jgi:membrane protease YdiL (CAAX protease family)
VLLAAALSYLVVLALAASSEFRLILVSGLESVPFLPLTMLAYLGQRVRWARALTFVYYFLLVGVAALAAWLTVLEPLMNAAALETLAAYGAAAGPVFRRGGMLLAHAGLYGVGLGVLVGMLGFEPAVRRAAARVLPLDPDSFVHATALATVLGLTVIAFVPLVVLGEPPLLMMAPDLKDLRQGSAADTDPGAELRSTVYACLWLVPGTVVAVGYPRARDLGAALRRLGLVRPTLRQLVLAVVLIPALVGTMSVADHVIEALWKHFEWPATDEKAFDELMKFALNPLGALVIGVTAGLGEELAVRGVLQPRLGIVLSNLFFTSLHALQYNGDGLLSVFLIGLCLGVLRKYTNTSTSAIVHGGYDFTLVMMQVMGR